MADTQILPGGVTAAPQDYTVADAQVVTIGALHAHYDGSGAAGSYVPTVDVISDSAHRVISVPHDTTIAAGTSAEASWAPFLRTAAAAAATPLNVPYFYTVLDADYSVPYDTAAGWHSIVWNHIHGTADVALDGFGGILLNAIDQLGGTWEVFFSVRFLFAGGATDFVAVNFEAQNLTDGAQSQIVDPTKGYTYNAALRKNCQLTGTQQVRVDASGAPALLLTTVGQRVSNVLGDVKAEHQQTKAWGYMLSNRSI